MRITLFSLLLLLSFSLHARVIELNKESPATIGQNAWLLQEQATRLGLVDAREAFAAGEFIPSEDSYLDFGIGAAPRWLRFELLNDSDEAVERRLAIETSWLDHIEIYFLTSGTVQQRYRLGDAQPFTERPIADRFFVVDHAFPPGVTTLYMRVDTPDPMVLPIYLTSRESAYSRQLLESYSYGLVYGVIAALLLYNLMLFFGLKSSRHFFYALYLLFFLLMNISYTGHGYRWLWPEATTWQLWSNPVLMIAYAISGLLFATRFLGTRSAFPRLHRLSMGICWLFTLGLVVSVLGGGHVAALLLAFSFVVLYTMGMVLLGALSLYAGNQSAKYFLYASIVAAVGATITALTVWGMLPYSPLGYRAVDIGIVFEAILLALALADLFRRNQEERIRAEQMARIDPLTGLNNRRAFSEFVDRLWKLGIRNNHEMSLLVIDIDRFKLINDTHGHAHGDQVLVEVARTIAASARAEDILARWGGEEFILFMPETSLQDATAVAERIRANIEALRFELDGSSHSVTASLGLARAKLGSDSLDRLISTADHYLYRAKATGRNCVCSELSG
jgi:diguanylate cyclase (GGDEF)-like protein